MWILGPGVLVKFEPRLEFIDYPVDFHLLQSLAASGLLVDWIVEASTLDLGEFRVHVARKP